MHARVGGVRFEFLVSPTRFIGDDKGHVRKIEMQRMRLGTSDDFGRPRQAN